MIRKCYKLTFESPLHISSGGFALEGVEPQVRSDTLYSALCTTAAYYWKDEAKIADFFFPEPLEQPRFRLSSTFPFVENQYFLPKPHFFRPAVDLLHQDKKRLRKARFVESSLWKDLIVGQRVPFYTATKELCAPKSEAANVVSSTIRNACWTNTAWPTDQALYQEFDRPRVTVDRVSSEATIFHFGEISFNDKAGLYFMADFEKMEDVNTFEVLLNVLSEDGIGADRTVGRGQFSVETVAAPIEARPDPNAEAFISLSLFVPTSAEIAQMDLAKSWYDFTLRRGWVSNNELRRKTLRMFTEGSAFSLKNPSLISALPKGRLIKALDKTEISPLKHDVWRSGVAFVVPLPNVGVLED